MLVLLASCGKETISEPLPQPADPHPAMHYVDLSSAVVKPGSTRAVDIDGDGSVDLRFLTQLVGDPALQRDRLQYLATSGIGRNLLNDAADESPMLARAQTIGKVMTGYSWYEISSIVLAEKITTYSESYWTGRWKDADRRYLPVQLQSGGAVRHGWVELSFHTATGEMILHRAAISLEAEKAVEAGH